MPELAERNITIRMPSIPTTETERSNIVGDNKYLNTEIQSKVLGSISSTVQRRG